MNSPVIASIATLPDRLDLFKQTLESLAPQIDHVNIYFDGHEHFPDGILGILHDHRVSLSAQSAKADGQKRGDAGKFYWAAMTHGYHFTCDDDIVYPADYVAKMVEMIERYERRVCVGVLGALFREPIRSYYRNRTKIETLDGLDEPVFVHALGTGTLAYHTSTIRLSRTDFLFPNMADVWFAIAAKRQRVPLVAVPRPKDWLRVLSPPEGTTIWEQYAATQDDHVQTEAIVAEAPWDIPLADE